jgi:hypothetical protein
MFKQTHLTNAHRPLLISHYKEMVKATSNIGIELVHMISQLEDSNLPIDGIIFDDSTIMIDRSCDVINDNLILIDLMLHPNCDEGFKYD